VHENPPINAKIRRIPAPVRSEEERRGAARALSCERIEAANVDGPEAEIAEDRRASTWGCEARKRVDDVRDERFEKAAGKRNERSAGNSKDEAGDAGDPTVTTVDLR
jgi:hypothetical protein